MINSVLLDIFQQLSAWEIRALDNFVRSPFFNQREDVVELFRYLVRYREGEQEMLDKKVVFKTLFPNEIYDDDQMRLVMHFLLKNIKTFISYQEWKEDPIETKILLCRGLRKRELTKTFQKEVKALKKKKGQRTHRNARFHFQNFQLALEEYAFEYRRRRTGKTNLNTLTDELTAFYIADMYRHACALLSHQSISTQNYNLGLVEDILSRPENTHFHALPAVAIYRCAYETLSQPDQTQGFIQLKKSLDLYRQYFPPEEFRDLYLLAINYCIRRLNAGEKSFIREAFELYRSGLENQALLEDGRLSKFTYNNVLMLGLGLEEWDWAQQFLETCKSLLPTHEEENIYHYNLSIYHFRRKEYTRAMELLREVTFEDVQYDLNARRMLLRIYFELKELPALESLLDSFQIFIRRRKELGYHKENYLNLISFMKKLLRLTPHDKSALSALRQMVANTEGVAEKKWLLEQMGDERRGGLDKGDVVKGDIVKGDVVKGDIVKGDVVKGDVVKGDVVKGDIVKGDIVKGDIVKGDIVKGDIVKGDVVKGDIVKGDIVKGDVVKGDIVKGDIVKGDIVKGDIVKGDIVKGDIVKGDIVKGDIVKGDVVKGEQRTGGLEEA